ncbi:MULTISPECIES: TRAP transporter small permease subunit [unclassified Imperialibacter]|uniref:TRAP transporter small permease subunit n=1 Tax=unclassified Imperialibacter TaxID=2629706 RepID=UPI001252CE2D|nr:MULTISPECIES: TRAP transporter small permease subunit [unclassified Imperialibacter]CAD5274209.1 TRAP-type mannitol/chloroaromatic compound transport system, small permease component [Imperialibacter sp. 75]CAD5287830.1 TRAP-type mannitol/chloroaromatic compound transport system, small permease component [Imperialibacter sp. 89]VVT35559.1 TRAP-type mannitol/chloroaromatic compound transport system, small permease component [Imperialibacter sp. EC-SDR9]
MHLLTLISERIDALNEYTGRLISWLAGIMVLVFCFDVAMRYIFNVSFASVFELEWHFFAAIFLIGAGYTLKHDKHVRVDVFYGEMSPRKQAYVNLLGVLLFLLPICVVIIKTSLLFVYNSWIIRENSPDPGGLPARYIIKAFIPMGFFLLFLQGVSVAFKSLSTILNPLKSADNE